MTAAGPPPPAGPVPGRWLVARTLVGSSYPCRCRLGKRCSPAYCPCAGRVDLDAVPARCCAHHHTPDVAAAAQAARDRHWSRHD